MRPIVCFLVSTLVWFTLASTASAQNISMPNVMGMTEAAAREALTAAGVEGKIHAEVDKGGNCAQRDVEEAHVCGQSPGVAKEQAAFLDVWLVLQGRRAREEGEQVQAAPEIQMPYDVVGKTEEQAIERLVALGFTGAIDVQPSPQECKHAEGRVCGTDPGSRRRVPADSDVVVLIQPKRTLQSSYARPPDLEGKTLAEAIDILFEKNLRLISITLVDDVRCKPGVVCQMREYDEFISRRSQFYFSIGTAYPGREKTPSYRQPELTGDDLMTVIKKVDALGTGGKVATETSRGVCSNEESDGLKPRSVCRQNPHPGTKTSGQYTRVILTTDAVEAPQVASTTMPDVVGMPIDEATATLEAAGLKRNRVKETSTPGCQPGTVCSTRPVAGKKAYAQTVQTLFIGATEAAGSDIGAAPVGAELAPGEEGDDGGEALVVDADATDGGLDDGPEEIPGYEPFF